MFLKKRLRMNVDNVIYNLYVLWRIKRLWKAVLQDICWFDSFSLTKIIIMKENEKNFNFKAVFYLLWLLSSKVLIFNVLVLLDISNFVSFLLMPISYIKSFLSIYILYIFICTKRIHFIWGFWVLWMVQFYEKKIYILKQFIFLKSDFFVYIFCR